MSLTIGPRLRSWNVGRPLRFSGRRGGTPMSIVAIIRPGLTEYDEQDRIQGSLDLPLSEQREAQITQIVDQLRGLGIEQIYTSPTDPARSTARQGGDALDVAVKEEEGLADVSLRQWR